MQNIMPPVGAGMQLIQSYSAGGFKIGNVLHQSAVIVTPHTTLEWSGALTIEAMHALFGVAPPIEVLLLGTGLHHEMVSPELRRGLKEHGITVDSMNTGAACRTFNVLLAEGRRAAAALRLPV